MPQKAGLLHRHWQSDRLERDGSHVQLGAEVARRYKLDPITLNSIESHHGDVEPESLIACLVSAADAISLRDPERVAKISKCIFSAQKLEDIASSMDGVENLMPCRPVAMIRVIVVPDEVDDDSMPL